MSGEWVICLRSPEIRVFLTSKSINWLLHSKKAAIFFQKFRLLCFHFFKESHIGVLIIQLKSQSRKKYLKEPLDLLPVFILVLSLWYQFKNLSASSNVFDFDTESDSITLFHLCQLSWFQEIVPNHSSRVFSALERPNKFIH